MHLLTILAFAFLFWRSDQPESWAIIGNNRIGWVIALAFVPSIAITIAATLTARRARQLLDHSPSSATSAMTFHHRTTGIFRFLLILSFGASVFLTTWPELFFFGGIHPALQIVGDFLTLIPFLLGAVGLWLAAFPLEKAVRGDFAASGDSGESGLWRWTTYLDFQIRHHLLIVAVPMSIILFASNMTRGFGERIESMTGIAWAPDGLLGLAAMLVFVAAPALLRRIWRTEPLQPGPMRERLEALCRRIHLRCREILVWKSDGMMINAAVMGVFAPVRYVLLSDALLATMNEKQIEAVFGHEAGHVRQHHMQHFLAFAMVGWFAVSGLMELMAIQLGQQSATRWFDPALVVQAVGIGATIAFWGIGFGWLSRRFEYQADLFGARCVTPDDSDCNQPCSVHLAGSSQGASSRRVCATGATVFASALDRVALLNGIPTDEKGWRHPSISGRVRFLATLAGDPNCAESFERNIRRLKIALIVLAIVGALATGTYLWLVPEPAVLKLQLGTM